MLNVNVIESHKCNPEADSGQQSPEARNKIVKIFSLKISCIDMYLHINKKSNFQTQITFQKIMFLSKSRLNKVARHWNPWTVRNGKSKFYSSHAMEF